MIERYMKDRFERMTLDQLDAIYEVLCYLYPPMEAPPNDTVAYLWNDLEEVRLRKSAEWEESDEYKRKCEETQREYEIFFLGKKEDA